MFSTPPKPIPRVVEISQDTLAEMVGTTRPRISFFMKKFEELVLFTAATV
jgi:predicted XRE-type DNA-binding protein